VGQREQQRLTATLGSLFARSGSVVCASRVSYTLKCLGMNEDTNDAHCPIKTNWNWCFLLSLKYHLTFVVVRALV